MRRSGVRADVGDWYRRLMDGPGVVVRFDRGGATSGPELALLDLDRLE
jgi:hypothetical protein